MDADFPMPSDPQRATPAERVWLEFQAAMEALPPIARAAFMLHDVSGATVEEVSEALGLPPQACIELVALARTCVREHAPHMDCRARPS